MNRHILLVLVATLVSFVMPVSASPVVGTDLSVEIGGHRWGLWSLVDTPSHDYTSRAFREARWFYDGSEKAKSQRFYSYWILGLGPFGAIYLSYGLVLVLAVLVLLVVTVTFRKRFRGAHGGNDKLDRVAK